MKIQCIDVFDVHCHMMWGVDDGSESREQSKRMLSVAYEEGIRSIILTPHYGRKNNSAHEWIYDAFNKMKVLAGECQPDISLYFGCELFYSSDILNEIDKGLVPSLAESRYMLVEFSPSASFIYIKNGVIELRQRGFIPIIAHAERCMCLIDSTQHVEELYDTGALIQINASTVTGENGIIPKKFFKKLMKIHCVHFVGTDAHGDVYRAPRIRNAYTYIAKRYGIERAEELFVKNPQCIIKNTDLEE
ncbi:MAG: CpsB/CapC family capsule biosynthesis tyrosine phosphatase [Lachnospiraceae bacterium]